MSFGMAYATKKKCAKGGEVKGVHKQHGDRREGTSEAGHFAKYKTSGDDGSKAYTNGMAKKEHAKVLGEMAAMPKPNLPMAEGGDVSEHEQDADMIARIMHKRKEYAHGGVVANEDAPIADSMPAEFDDMEVDDHLEGEQPEDSNEHGDDDVGDDPIDRIMMKRKKDKMPRPA